MANHQNLFSEFPSITSQEWKDKVIKDLKGRSFEDLQWALENGIVIEPFYTKSSNGNAEITQFGKEDNNWEISEDFVVSDDLKKDNQQLLESLMGGIDAPRIFLDRNISVEELTILFNGVEFDYISTHIRLSDNVNSSVLYKDLTEYIESRNKNIKELKGSILGREFQEGIKAKTIGVQAGDFYDNDIPKELARTIRLGVDTIMSSVEEEQLESAFHSMIFVVKIGTSHFPSIAKIRALQLLWARICKGFNLEYIRPEIEIEFSDTAYTEERNSNMIRATTMAMSAIVAGADRLVVLPSDSKTGEVSSFSRRIARNVQHLLKMESFMDKVVDPASGSYYIEQMTDVFVEKAWAEFLEMEK